MNELREIQNQVFGIARSIKGIQNDLHTRHKSRAIEKLYNLSEVFGTLGDKAFIIAEVI